MVEADLIFSEEKAKRQRWDLPIGKQRTAYYLQGKQSPLSDSKVTINIVVITITTLWGWLRMGRGKVDKGCKRKIKVAQNETSHTDCIPAIRVWQAWLQIGQLNQILAYLALIAYWSCKCCGGRVALVKWSGAGSSAAASQLGLRHSDEEWHA